MWGGGREGKEEGGGPELVHSDGEDLEGVEELREMVEGEFL